jgi:hypothetical protein
MPENGGQESNRDAQAREKGNSCRRRQGQPTLALRVISGNDKTQAAWTTRRGRAC